MKNKYTVEGMTCSACSATVHRTVQKIQGVKEVNVNLLTKSMTVELDENIDNLNIDEKIIEAVTVPVTRHRFSRRRRLQEKRKLVPILSGKN